MRPEALACLLATPALVLSAAEPAGAGTFDLTKAWLRAVNGRDLDGLMGIYDRDPFSVKVQLDGQRRQSWEEIRESWRALFEANTELQVEVKEIYYLASPDGVFAQGTAIFTSTPKDGARVSRTVRFAQYRMKRQGRWVLRFDSAQEAKS
jgi:uncharacterized protein (TIGR02246 family)